MAKKIKFVFFSEKIILQNSDLSLAKIWNIISKRNNASDKHITINDNLDVPESDPNYKIIMFFSKQFKAFQSLTSKFKRTLNGK